METGPTIKQTRKVSGTESLLLEDYHNVLNAYL
jgi:hypothetical protein